MSAFGQHRKFPPHARKTSGTHACRVRSEKRRLYLHANRLCVRKKHNNNNKIISSSVIIFFFGCFYISLFQNDAILSRHSAYFCPLSRRCRISCFPVYKLVRFYVNSRKSLIYRYPLQWPFQIFFMTILLFLCSGKPWIYILFSTV